MWTRQFYSLEVSHALILVKVNTAAWVQHIRVLCIAAILCFCLRLLDSIHISTVTNIINIHAHKPINLGIINTKMKVNSLEPYDFSDVGTRNLNDDLNDFLALVPLNEVIAIVLDYLANDQEVQELILYLQSEEFHKIVITVEELDEFKLVSIIAHTCISQVYMQHRK